MTDEQKAAKLDAALDLLNNMAVILIDNGFSHFSRNVTALKKACMLIRQARDDLVIANRVKNDNRT